MVSPLKRLKIDHIVCYLLELVFCFLLVFKDKKLNVAHLTAQFLDVKVAVDDASLKAGFDELEFIKVTKVTVYKIFLLFFQYFIRLLFILL